MTWHLLESTESRCMAPEVRLGCGGRSCRMSEPPSHRVNGMTADRLDLRNLRQQMEEFARPFAEKGFLTGLGAQTLVPASVGARDPPENPTRA